MLITIGLIGSLLTSLLLFFFGSKLFRKIGLVDKPHLYPHEAGRDPLPYPLGLLLSINMLLWLPWILLMIPVDDLKKTLYVALVGLLISLVMAFDDQKRNLGPKLRLVFQIAIGTFFGLTAIKIGYISNIFGGILQLDQIASLQWEIAGKVIYLIPLIVTIIWYVLVMNAFNWSDNGKGMSSGLALTTFIVLAVLSMRLYLIDDDQASRDNSLFVLAHLTILIPTVFVFWRYDVTRRCISGDAGTMYLGFMIATLAIVSGGKIATVAIVMGIYLIDAFYVITRRVLSRKSPFKGDFTHLHHRLESHGVSAVKQRWIVYGLSFVFGIGAVFLNTIGKVALFGIIGLTVILLGWVASKRK